MVSVTRRIKQIKQPRGGYLPIREWEVTQLPGAGELFPEESLHPALVGLVVDYLTRYQLGAPREEVFSVSLMGARLVGEFTNKAVTLLLGIEGLDYDSILNAAKLSAYDQCYRANLPAPDLDNIKLDEQTASNIVQMVKNALTFFKEYGPVTQSMVVFPGGYTNTVHSGDGDFLTADTLWDFKVSKYPPTKDHSLQLLMYYVMGLHSVDFETFNKLSHLGVYNPRRNEVYRLQVSNIPKEVLTTVENDIICY